MADDKDLNPLIIAGFCRQLTGIADHTESA